MRVTTTENDQSDEYRQLIIDFLCLNLGTCERCAATEDALDGALEALGPVFNVLRIVPNLNRVDITTRELAEQYRLVSSPTVRVDGVDISVELNEGHDHEKPPAGVIADGILKVLYGQLAAAEPVPYSMPDDLVHYFDGTTAHPSR